MEASVRALARVAAAAPRGSRRKLRGQCGRMAATPLHARPSARLAAPPDDSRPVAAREVHGEPDGTPLRLPSGVLIHRRRIGDLRVSAGESQEAYRGIATLPRPHQAAIARAGVPVYLVPSTGLEDGLLGATTIVQDTNASPWRPTLVRVAVKAGRSGHEATTEIVQHEVGHVLAVLTGQDRSEAAAEVYARRY